MVVFLDTYALIEIDKGNPNYKEYSLDSKNAITAVFNLIEAHFYYLKNFGVNEADEVYRIVKRFTIPISESIIKEANLFKKINLKKRFSFADCIGYTAAKRYDAKFITGDYMFKGLENVEFVR